MFKRQIVVDAKGHLMGRLASYIAKELLNGQRVVIVRSEKVLISGSLFRNKTKFILCFTHGFWLRTYDMKARVHICIYKHFIYLKCIHTVRTI